MATQFGTCVPAMDVFCLSHSMALSPIAAAKTGAPLRFGLGRPHSNTSSVL